MHIQLKSDKIIYLFLSFFCFTLYLAHTILLYEVFFLRLREPVNLVLRYFRSPLSAEFCKVIFIATSLRNISFCSGVTHVLVDEVHERDKFSDFLLIALRDALARLKDLKLVLMSATMDTQIFSRYLCVITAYLYRLFLSAPL